MTAETFGQLVARHRIAAGLSQNALARMAGIDPAYVHRIEAAKLGRSGKALEPRRPIVLALACVLDLDEGDRDRFLACAGLAPVEDWQTRAEVAEAKLQMIVQTLDAPAELLIFPRRRTG